MAEALQPALRRRAVFVDTSAFYGYVDHDDQWHQLAVEGFSLISAERRLLFTTNLVVAETYGLVLHRLGYPVAQQWLDALDSVNLVFQRREHHQAVQALLGRYRGYGFSYTDVLSFVVMEEVGISMAFAFDRHFREYGFDTL